VREELKALIARARAPGLGPRVMAAVKEIDRRLHIYPQCGQPLRNLLFLGQPAQLWLCVVEPFAVHYVLDEDRHAVMVIVPFRTLPTSGR
jgi:hypothetical protein